LYQLKNGGGLLSRPDRILSGLLFQSSSTKGYLAFPILNIFVPHLAQVPVVAGLSFFITIALGLLISLLALHLTQ
jgi:hypothetical protein